MLVLTYELNDDYFNFKNNLNTFKDYIIDKKNVNVFIKTNNKYKLLNSLYNIAIIFKIENLKQDNRCFIKNNNKNIKEYISIINNCMKSIDICNMPSNIATPKFMANYIKKLFKNNKDVKIKIISDVNAIKKLNFDSLYYMNKLDGEPYFVIIEKIIKNIKPTCIIGKGITYDSGGTYMKNDSSLYYMKMDKLGACYGTHIIKHFVDNNPKLSLVGLFAFSDNIINKSSLKPGDIINSHSKKKIEVYDTDAEGRLLIADCISYSLKYKPKNIIDITTLTMTNYTCDDYGVFFTENKYLKNKIEKISTKLNERMNGIPIYINKEKIKSINADIKNYSDNCKNGGDAYIASMFLHEFIPKNFKNWVHFDISNEIIDDGTILIPNGKGFISLIELIKN